jgi:protein-tyrosine phosphatase
MNLIDLHCHILPGIDDGPKTLQESLEMARIFEQAGYSHVVATPHAVPGTTWMPKPEEVRDHLTELNQAIVKNGIKLKVLPGMEIALDPNISDLLDQGQVQALAGTSYVLIEPPFQRLPLGWDQAVFNVLSRGFSVLLAHPERCAQLSAKPQICDKLIESGVYFQVNWDSFLGHHGRTTQKMAIYLAGKAYIHCLATDSHDSKSRNAIQVQQTAETIEELMGHRNLQLISRDNPIRVLRNEALESMESQGIQVAGKKKRRWRFWKNGAEGNPQITPPARKSLRLGEQINAD